VRDHVPQTLAFDALHRDEDLPVGLVDLEYRADVGVAERGRRLGLMEEPRAGRSIARPLRRQELERHYPFELEVLGLVDDAHAALAELLDDPVVRDGLADHACSRWAAVIIAILRKSQTSA